ncbi:TraX family protein [Haloplasma contractile]|uniref:F pilin acetylation protein n=1 Tax=Haloplasma contractile SSD-17B TaxID=1033810 RepID=U2FPR9_9MOLU|nr:TraX family protein [Haloplasma contractile]ERJ13034.1 Putative F pilin acetylation protein [Haloplasma contractile SSD-17B]
MTSTKLKLLAILSMLIDHMAVVLIEQSDPIYIIMRGFGRLAFPIFAFLIAEGYVHTSNKLRYLFRLFLFALVSEIPFDLAFKGELIDFSSQNIFFTLSFGLATIYVYDQFILTELKQYGQKMTSEGNKLNPTINIVKILIGMLSIVIILLLADFIKTDYFSIGVLLIFIFYLFREHLLAKSVAFLFVNLVLSQFNIHAIQIVASLSLVLILLYNHKKGRNLKYLFYIFYPGHLLILSFLKYALTA